MRICNVYDNLKSEVQPVTRWLEGSTVIEASFSVFYFAHKRKHIYAFPMLPEINKWRSDYNLGHIM